MGKISDGERSVGVTGAAVVPLGLAVGLTRIFLDEVASEGLWDGVFIVGRVNTVYGFLLLWLAKIDEG